MVHPILPHLLQRLVSKPQGLKRYAARAKIAAWYVQSKANRFTVISTSSRPYSFMIVDYPCSDLLSMSYTYEIANIAILREKY